MTIDRRTILGGAAGLAATSLLSATARATGAPDDRKWIIVNALGGLADPNVQSAADPFSPRVLAEAHASGITAINCTLGYVAGPADPFEKASPTSPKWTCCCAAIRATSPRY